MADLLKFDAMLFFARLWFLYKNFFERLKIFIYFLSGKDGVVWQRQHSVLEGEGGNPAIVSC